MTRHMVAGGVIETVAGLVAFQAIGFSRALNITERTNISRQAGTLPIHVIAFCSILASAFVHTIFSV